MRKLKWVLISLGIALIVFVGYYGISIYQTLNNFNKDPGKTLFPESISNAIEPLAAPPKWEGKERVNILLLGGDSRGLKTKEIPRSDSMMIISIDPNTKKAIMFSILRDTYVKIPGFGEDRINTALVHGGPNLAMKTVSNLMGIPIQYYVYTDFQGFISVVNAVGGITLDVEKDMKYSDKFDGPEFDIDLKKGVQHLNGKTALQYVRFRHDALSDFARADRQRKFLKALAGELQTTLSILKMPQILNAIDPFIETNLNVSEMLRLGSLGYDAKTSGFIGQQIPPTTLLEEKNVHGADVIGVDPERLKKYVQTLFVESIVGSPSVSPSKTPTMSSKPTATNKPVAAISSKPIFFSTAKPTPSNSYKPTSTISATPSLTNSSKPTTPVLATPSPTNSAKPTSTISATPISSNTTKPSASSYE